MGHNISNNAPRCSRATDGSLAARELALFDAENGLANAEVQIRFFAQRPLGFGRDDPAKLLEELVGVREFVIGLYTFEKIAKVFERHGSTSRHFNGCQQLRKTQKVDALMLVFIPMREVKRGGIFGEKRRLRDV